MIVTALEQLRSCHHHCHRHAGTSGAALFLSLSRFITPTIGTIDPMITAENIIVNAYDPLMTMDHSRCQIGNGSNGTDRAVTARIIHGASARTAVN